jgi:hypothetical protein
MRHEKKGENRPEETKENHLMFDNLWAWWRIWCWDIECGVVGMRRLLKKITKNHKLLRECHENTSWDCFNCDFSFTAFIRERCIIFSHLFFLEVATQ